MNYQIIPDPFYYEQGSVPISVGAPHHGTLPDVDADWGTGPIASSLAEKLHGSVVVVSDMRRRVDVNKDPFRFSSGVRKHAVRYQDLLFKNCPELIIEIHGHISGRYDIEISTGFELDHNIPGDKDYIEALNQFRDDLSRVSAIQLGWRSTIGVWPLERDVVKTATDTFTFQKIRWARNLAGLNWYGLHIELNAELRVGHGSQAGNIKNLDSQVTNSLACALATAIQHSFEPLLSANKTVAERQDNYTHRLFLDQRRYKISSVPMEYASESIILMHPDTLFKFGALAGDTVIISHEAEEMSIQVEASRVVHKNAVGINQRTRNQVNVKPGEWITLQRPLYANSTNMANVHSGDGNTTGVVVHHIKQVPGIVIWLASSDIQRLGLMSNHPTQIIRRPGVPVMRLQSFQVNDQLPSHTAILSQSLADKLEITLGETLRLKQVLND